MSTTSVTAIAMTACLAFTGAVLAQGASTAAGASPTGTNGAGTPGAGLGGAGTGGTGPAEPGVVPPTGSRAGASGLTKVPPPPMDGTSAAVGTAIGAAK